MHTGDTWVKLSGDTREKVWYGKYLKWLIVVLFVLLLALKAVLFQPAFLLYASVLLFFWRTPENQSSSNWGLIGAT